MLTDAGHRALFVGGCVRNALLGQPVADIDIATDALPETVMALAKAAGLKAVPTGHRSWHRDGRGRRHSARGHDLSPRRGNRWAPCGRGLYRRRRRRRAAPRFHHERALCRCLTAQVIDPLGGLPDLQARRVRFIDDAEARIREDYLRILRFFRFHAWYGDPRGGLDAEGLAACARPFDGLDGLSRERVGAEMRKLLAAPDPAPLGRQHGRDRGVWPAFCPGPMPGRCRSWCIWKQDLGLSPDWLRRLAVLGGADVASGCALSRKDAKELGLIRDCYCRSDTPPAALGYRAGAHSATSALLVRAALLGQPLDADAHATGRDAARAQVLPVKAADLALAIRPRTGRNDCAKSRSAWIASDFSLGKDATCSHGFPDRAQASISRPDFDARFQPFRRLPQVFRYFENLVDPIRRVSRNRHAAARLLAVPAGLFAAVQTGVRGCRDHVGYRGADRDRADLLHGAARRSADGPDRRSSLGVPRHRTDPGGGVHPAGLRPLLQVLDVACSTTRSCRISAR